MAQEADLDRKRAIGRVGDRRGEETQQRLLRAAFTLFGRHGYDGVATRAIGAAAAVNQAAINYHFGGKRGLYLAAVRDVVGEIGARLGGAAGDLRAAAAAGDRATLARGGALFFTRLVATFIDEGGLAPKIGLVVREYSAPSDAFPLLYEGGLEPIHRAVAVFAAAALGVAPDHPRAVITAHGLIGQCAAFAVARVLVLRRLGRDSYGREGRALVTETVVAMTLKAVGLAPPGETMSKDD